MAKALPVINNDQTLTGKNTTNQHNKSMIAFLRSCICAWCMQASCMVPQETGFEDVNHPACTRATASPCSRRFVCASCLCLLAHTFTRTQGPHRELLKLRIGERKSLLVRVWVVATLGVSLEEWRSILRESRSCLLRKSQLRRSSMLRGNVSGMLQSHSFYAM